MIFANRSAKDRGHSYAMNVLWSKSMAEKKGRLAISAFIVSVFALASCSSAHTDGAVKRRFQEYMEAWENNDIETVWNMMSPRLKKGNDSSIIKFKSYVVQQGFRPSGYRIIKISIDSKKATVETEIQFSDFNGTKIGSEQEKCGFVLNEDTWYFDDCKPITR